MTARMPRSISNRMRRASPPTPGRPCPKLLEEQPILVAAIGTALGAIFGAAPPVSQAERSVLRQVGAEAIDKGRDVLQTAKETVGEQLADAHLGDKVGDMAGKLVDTSLTSPALHPGRGCSLTPELRPGVLFFFFFLSRHIRWLWIPRSRKSGGCRRGPNGRAAMGRSTGTSIRQARRVSITAEGEFTRPTSRPT